MSGPVSPLFLERYELKYVIPFALVDRISAYIAPFCDMDYYSKISPDGFYTINSLYLDTPTYYLLRQKENGIANRFSMRVRSYGDEPKAPYYFETKYKVLEFVKKKRGRVMIENWPDLLTNHDLIDNIPLDSRSNVQHFVDLASTYNVSPVILTQYRRRAFLSTIDDYARITFDRDLRYQREEEYNVTPNERKMQHYDDPDCFRDPMTNVVLELKCERKIPFWFIDMIQRFQLVRGSFSKYGNSMERQYLSQFSTEPYDMHPSLDYAPRSRF